jgi:hypothetical protein
VWGEGETRQDAGVRGRMDRGTHRQLQRGVLMLQRRSAEANQHKRNYLLLPPCHLLHPLAAVCAMADHPVNQAGVVQQHRACRCRVCCCCPTPCPHVMHPPPPPPPHLASLSLTCWRARVELAHSGSRCSQAPQAAPPCSAGPSVLAARHPTGGAPRWQER